ncbi:MAG: tetratricopeptide repeat protein [Methanotrichaceae archaeon]|nr:tetratricopeptide repeat protein [Methanotrichaceae archaeon]
MNIKKVILISIAVLLFVVPTLGQQEFLDIGNAMLLSQKYDEALRAYDRAIQIDPEFAEAWYNKAIVLEILGLYDDAEASLIVAFQLDPNLRIIYQNVDQVAPGLPLDQPAQDQADVIDWDNSINQNIDQRAMWDGVAAPTGGYACSGDNTNLDIYKQAAGCGSGVNACSSCSGI